MTKYPRLSTKLNTKEYLDLQDKKVRFGKFLVTVHIYESHNRYGSWERGFKFSDIKYGYLTRLAFDPKSGRKRKFYSFNHGATWLHPTEYCLLSIKGALRKTKGKVKVETYRSKEFAFEGIQKINRDWDPNYRWRR